MNIQEARELSQNVLDDKLTESQKKHKQKVKEVLETAHSFIESAAKKGEFSTMLCINYDRSYDELKFLESVVQEVKYKLIDEGYSTDVFNNNGIGSINITISW